MFLFRFLLVDYILGQPRRTFNDFQSPGQVTLPDTYPHARRYDGLNQIDIMDACLNSFIFKHILQNLSLRISKNGQCNKFFFHGFCF